MLGQTSCGAQYENETAKQSAVFKAVVHESLYVPDSNSHCRTKRVRVPKYEVSTQTDNWDSEYVLKS